MRAVKTFILELLTLFPFTANTDLSHSLMQMSWNWTLLKWHNWNFYAPCLHNPLLLITTCGANRHFNGDKSMHPVTRVQVSIFLDGLFQLLTIAWLYSLLLLKVFFSFCHIIGCNLSWNGNNKCWLVIWISFVSFWASSSDPSVM